MAEDPNIPGKGSPVGGAQRSASKENAKVELDLDDAPFLEGEEEPEPKSVEAPTETPKATDAVVALEAKPSLKDRLLANKKKLILAGGGAVALVILAVVVNIFLFSEPKPPPAPPAPEPEKVLATPPSLPEAPTPSFVMEWEPFWVDIRDTEGAIRFLRCKLSVPTENALLFAEMKGKTLILRDALFYYLRNQPILSLTDESRAQAFKADLMTVMNEHLASGKVLDVLIEDYLIQ